MDSHEQPEAKDEKEINPISFKVAEFSDQSLDPEESFPDAVSDAILNNANAHQLLQSFLLTPEGSAGDKVWEDMSEVITNGYAQLMSLPLEEIEVGDSETSDIAEASTIAADNDASHKTHNPESISLNSPQTSDEPVNQSSAVELTQQSHYNFHNNECDSNNNFIHKSLQEQTSDPTLCQTSNLGETDKDSHRSSPSKHVQTEKNSDNILETENSNRNCDDNFSAKHFPESEAVIAVSRVPVKHKESQSLDEDDVDIISELSIGGPLFICAICDKECDNKAALADHLIVHTYEIIRYPCHECGKLFLIKYLQQKYCSDCCAMRAFSDSEADLNIAKLKENSHFCMRVRQVPEKEKSISCKVCNKTCKSLKGLKKHHLIHTRNISYLFNKKERYSCDICGKSFAFRCRIKRHQEIHSEERLYLCAKCQLSFKTLQGQKKHQKMHNLSPGGSVGEQFPLRTKVKLKSNAY